MLARGYITLWTGPFYYDPGAAGGVLRRRVAPPVAHGYRQTELASRGKRRRKACGYLCYTATPRQMSPRQTQA